MIQWKKFTILNTPRLKIFNLQKVEVSTTVANVVEWHVVGIVSAGDKIVVVLNTEKNICYELFFGKTINLTEEKRKMQVLLITGAFPWI